MTSKNKIPGKANPSVDTTESSRLNPMTSLRQLAEKYLLGKKINPPKVQNALSSEDAQRIISELQTHQIELEIKNDELRRTQAELESARARYFDLYDLAPAGYCTVSEKGLMLETNLTAANLLGVTKGVLLNQPLTRFILKEDQDIFSLLSKQLFNTGESQSGELRLIRQDGTSFWVNLETTFSLTENGINVSRVALNNINKRKRAEKALRKIQRQNQAVKLQLQKAESLERMAGSISHLFNNHLQVALGNLEMALINLPDAAKSREYLIGAMKANRRSSDISGLLLTYLGQNSSKLEPLDLSEICRQSLPGLETAMPSGISIDTNFKFPGPVVCANKSLLQQVLTILITNAWEAIRDTTGKVTVVVKTVPASFIPDSHISHIEWVATSEMFACLEVADTGCGVVKEEMDKIFDPFYTTKSTGRGLGLAVAMSLIRAWRGFIHVNSEVQKGSYFGVFLPLAVGKCPQQFDLVTDKETFKAESSVLIVDDDPVLCAVMEAMLNHLGFTVFVAMTGAEAVALFQKHHNSIDCLVTDLSMPDMDGWETLEALRKIKPDLPAILASGYDEAHAMKGDHKELPQAFLHKPYTKDDLKNVLNRVLGDATRVGH